MPGKSRKKKRNRRHRLAASALPHEVAVNQSSQVVHTCGQSVASPSHAVSTTDPPSLTPSGILPSENDNPSELIYSIGALRTSESNKPDRDDDESSDEFICNPCPDDGDLLGAINSESSYEAVALLTRGNIFTPEGINQALLSACRRGHKLLVQTLVRVGANIEHRDEHGNTPLLICAENGFTDIVRFLVSRHANINAVNSVGNTALILSVRSAGSTDLTRFLLEQRDVDIHHKNQHGHTALMRAIQFMDVDTMILLLQNRMRRTTDRGYRINSMIKHELDSSFFNSKSQELEHQVIAGETGLRDVFIILMEHLITRTSPLELAIKVSDIKSLEILLDCQFSSSEEKKKYINNSLTNLFTESRRKSVGIFTSTEINIVRLLLKYGADVNQGYGSKMISLAVESGNFQLVELLCTHGADMKGYYSIGQDPLVIAARIGRQDLIELLLKYKADLNRTDFSDSALDCALRNDHTECAKLLIQRGAKMEVKSALRSAIDHQIPNYMHFLFENYSCEIMDYFLQKPLKVRKLLTSAAEKGNCKIIGQLLNAGAGVNEADSTGQTPLMTSKNREVAEFLIQRGADVNREIEGRSGSDTALSHVIKNRECKDKSTVELCKVLIDSGASVNCRNGEGETLLMMAASEDDCVDMLQMLLDNGADVNDTDNEGNTAIFHALRRQHSKNVMCLVDSTTDKKSVINIQNKEGITPLIFSVQGGNVPIVKELLENGADVNIKDNKENTALHHLLIAYHRNIEEILTSLLKAGSDVNCQNSDGLSPLMLAAKKTMSSVMSSLLEAGADVNAVSKKNNSQTALSFLPDIESCLGNFTKPCIETLLDGGASCSYLRHECIHNLIINNQVNIIPKLIQHGVGLADVEANNVRLRIRSPGVPSTLSPLCVALLLGKVNLARYFVDILFLTRSDLSMFASNKAMECLLQREDQRDSLRFLQDQSSQPMSLIKLCLVAVSAAVGSSPGREARVDSLPLPQMMKDRLLFKSVGGEHATLAEIPSESSTLLDRAGLVSLLRNLQLIRDADLDYDGCVFYASDPSDCYDDSSDVDYDYD